MKKMLLLFSAAILLIPALTQAQTSTCEKVYFHQYNSYGHCDLTDPCIIDYNGALATLPLPGYPSDYCDGCAFGMATGVGYIILGPISFQTHISFDYFVIVNGRLKISWVSVMDLNSADPQNSPWIELESMSPVQDVCASYVSAGTIPANSYIFLSQGNGSGGPGGPLKYFLHAISTNNPVPVELVSFNAGRVGSSVKLTWKTATEQNNYGFEIERKSGGDWQNVAFVAGHGSSNTPQNYVYMDRPNVASGEVQYRLRQIDRDGSATYSPIASVSMGAIKGFGLRSAYPNPFNPITTLSFELTQDATVTLKIFNESGQEVTTLISGEYMTAGSYSRIFQGGSLPSGNYVAWLFTDGESSLLPLTLAK